MRRWVCFTLFSLFALSIFSQATGLRSPKTKWNQIKTDTVRIIYPEGLESKAERIANVIHKMARTTPIETPAHLRKISILLQNESTISNGYVGYGPYRSEFYLQPYQNPFSLGSLPWEDLLAIHEFRHVQQLSATNVGLSNVMFSLFGENAYIGSVNLAVPDWYIEGDAVVSETALTKQGRGRLNAFTRGFYEKLKQGKSWRYDVVRNGSFQQWLPNEYPLGYLMCSYGRETHGQDMWDEVILDAASYKGLFYPFSKALKARTGMGTNTFYDSTMQHYVHKWNLEDSRSLTYQSIPINSNSWSRPNQYRDFRYPSVDSSGAVYTVIDRFDKMAGIYRINPNGKMQHIVSLGASPEPYFSMNGEKLCWTEIRTHPRWDREDRSVIMVYDLKRKSKKQLTTEGRYFTPALSEKGDRIIALHTDEFGQHELRIINATDGKVLEKIENRNNLYFSYPSWVNQDNQILVSARDGLGRMNVVFIDLETGKMDRTVHWNYNVYGRPILHKDWVIVSTNINETDHIYAINPNEGIPYEVTIGNDFFYDPAYDPVNNELVCAQFSLHGHRLKRIPVDAGTWSVRNLDRGVKPMLLESDETDILSSVPQKRYTASRYSKWSNPINIHSANVTLDDPIYEIEVLTENLLSTVGLSGGYRYNRNNRSFGPFVNLTLSHWYPELSIGFRGVQRNFRDQNNARFRLRQNTLNAGVRLPFRFTSGTFNQVASLSTSVNSGTVSLRPEGNFNRQDISYMTYSAFLYNARRQSYQHAVPSFGQSARVSFSHSINALEVNQVSVTSDFTFPGFSNNHAFILQFDYVSEIDSNDVTLGESFQFSRGWSALRNDRSIRFGINYHMPIAYPDFGIAGIVYFRRIRMKPFFDYTQSKLNGTNFFLRSAGSEFIFDLNIFNVQPVTFGIRYARLLNEIPELGLSKNQFEFFIPLDRI